MYRTNKSLIIKLFTHLTLFIMMVSSISCAQSYNPCLGISPPIDMPKTFSQSGTAHLPDKWWTVFDDPQLSELIKTALSDNMNLKIIWFRLLQSKAIARKSGADLSPKVDGSFGDTYTTTKVDGMDKTYSNQFSMGVVASYELDLWGRLDSARDAAKLDISATVEDLQAAAISLSAEVATVWYKIVESRGQLELLNKQIMNNEDYLEIVTMRFRQGQVSSIDVLQQRQSLEAMREKSIRVELNMKILEHQLALLVGKAPGRLTIPKNSKLPILPPLPKTSVPSTLLQRRPDLRSAYIRVKASYTRVDTAIANQYPRISLSASVSSSDTVASNLFENWISNLTANLLVPIFDAGARKAEVDRAKAVGFEALHRYGQVTLNALKEVEDALDREAMQLMRLESLKKQIALSEKSVLLTRESYTHGATDFLRLLNTLLGHHSLQREQLAAERELIEYRISLCRAIGGGWIMDKSDYDELKGITDYPIPAYKKKVLLPPIKKRKEKYTPPSKEEGIKLKQ